MTVVRVGGHVSQWISGGERLAETVVRVRRRGRSARIDRHRYCQDVPVRVVGVRGGVSILVRFGQSVTLVVVGVADSSAPGATGATRTLRAGSDPISPNRRGNVCRWIAKRVRYLRPEREGERRTPRRDAANLNANRTAPGSSGHDRRNLRVAPTGYRGCCSIEARGAVTLRCPEANAGNCHTCTHRSNARRNVCNGEWLRDGKLHAVARDAVLCERYRTAGSIRWHGRRNTRVAPRADVCSHTIAFDVEVGRVGDRAWAKAGPVQSDGSPDLSGRGCQTIDGWLDHGERDAGRARDGVHRNDDGPRSRRCRARHVSHDLRATPTGDRSCQRAIEADCAVPWSGPEV